MEKAHLLFSTSVTIHWQELVAKPHLHTRMLGKMVYLYIQGEEMDFGEHVVSLCPTLVEYKS